MWDHTFTSGGFAMACNPCEGLNVAAVALYPFECRSPKDYSGLRILPFTSAKYTHFCHSNGKPSKLSLDMWVRTNNSGAQKTPAVWDVIGPKFSKKCVNVQSNGDLRLGGRAP